MNRVLLIPLIGLFLLVIDYYLFQGVKAASQSFGTETQRVIKYAYWTFSILAISSLFLYFLGNPDSFGKHFRTFLMVGFFANILSKVFLLLFVLSDDVSRGVRWAYRNIGSWFGSPELKEAAGTPIPRSEFISKVGIVAAAVPLVGISWGIVSGAHDYRVRKRTVYLPNLPTAFDGFRIAQVSDIHSGSFWNKNAVIGGVEMVNKEKADVIFFTGDLVNNKASEMSGYTSVFNKFKAPLGVYSVLGNHDYGDYVKWKSVEEKQQNLQDLITLEKQMGWKVLLNENDTIKVDGESLSVIGIENWSSFGNFPKHGKLAEAHHGTEESAVKVLLSHDPSHWDAEVVGGQFSDIDLTLSGHTHGMQFGVDIGEVRWSPVQYFYKQWADLYQKEQQHLYVNRGFGYIGYPGRLGIPPEITIIELKKA